MQTRHVAAYLLVLSLAACQQPSPEAGQSQAPATTAAPTASPAAGTATTPAAAVPADAVSIVRSLDRDSLPSEPGVGSLKEGKMTSSGKPGFLVYGPYASLKAGRYELTVKGAVASLAKDSTIVVDVAAGAGSTVLGSREVSSPPRTAGVLARFEVSVPTDILDAEVRVKVPADSSVSVTGYRLTAKH